MTAYEAAGGDLKRDLFDERNEGYATDAALVERLFAQKLEILADDLRQEGWAWVEIKPEMDWHSMPGYGRVYPVEVERSETEGQELSILRDEREQLEALVEDEDRQARLAEISLRIDEIDRSTYLPADLQRADALVSLDYTGEAVFHRGDLKPEPARAEIGRSATIFFSRAFSSSSCFSFQQTGRKLRCLHRLPFLPQPGKITGKL